jgi:uncharacterized membrane protein YqiK
MQKTAQDQRLETEQATGRADMQKSLAQSEVGITIKKNNADAREQEARGDAEYTRKTGLAQADVIRAQGVAKAEGFKAQNDAIGQTGTMLVNIATVLADKGIKIMPEILVAGGNGPIDGLAATLMKNLSVSSASKPAI